MKTVLRIIFLFFLVLCTGSCRTKEKVTERLRETAQASTSGVVKEARQTGHQVESNSSGETTHTQWSDSTVERFHERIVTDSSGRVLWQETEHSKERYTGKARSNTNRSNSIQETVESQDSSITEEQKDSLYNGGVLQEVTVVRSRPCNWLWWGGLLVILLVFCAILITRWHGRHTD